MKIAPRTSNTNTFCATAGWAFGIVLFCLGYTCTALGQPLWSSKTKVEGRLVFKDAHLHNKYYYGPGKLALATDSEGKPVFQLVSMRYTGTTLSNDRDEKRFTNLLSFGVNMEPVSAASKNAIKATLHLPASADLSPLPIRHLESTIIAGVGNGGDTDNSVRKQTGSEQDKDTAPGVYWTERTFTVALDNHDAQILLDQYANGRIAVSLNYTFYANVLKVQEESLQVSGDSAFVESMKGAVDGITRDTDLVSEAILGDALNISVDVQKYPDAIKKMDINEHSIPPAYAAFEVKCYDFALGTRPDLSMKTVEIEATSVIGTPVLIKTKFFKRQPDLSSKYVSFPYAVLLDKPIRYRVKESDLDGGTYYSPWKLMEQFTNLIDASTPQEKNPLIKRSIDVEILPEYMSDKNVQEANVHFVYQRNGQKEVQSLVFNKENGEFFKNICLVFEAEKPLQYFITRVYSDGRKTKGVLRIVGKDDYVLVGK